MLEDIRELLWDVEGAESLHDIRVRHGQELAVRHVRIPLPCLVWVPRAVTIARTLGTARRPDEG